jgi:hypothetical protein
MIQSRDDYKHVYKIIYIYIFNSKNYIVVTKKKTGLEKESECLDKRNFSSHEELLYASATVHATHMFYLMNHKPPMIQ